MINWNKIISMERKQNTDKYKKDQKYRLLPYYKSVEKKWIKKSYHQMVISLFCLPYGKADDTPSPLLSRARSKRLRLRP